MELIWHAILLSLLAGGAAFVGALIGRAEKLKPDWISCETRHGIMALGGGALLAAVALVLVPDGTEMQPAWLAIATFLIGAILFMGLDWYLEKRGTAASQLVALLLDFIPETIVLGAVISVDYRQAVFLGVIIAVQNLPEGFNAYREIRCNENGGLLRKHVLWVMAGVALTGPLFALIGFYLFEHGSVELGSLMTLCAGGIFYLVFRDIAPEAKLEKHWLPSFGAVIGFTIGMIGHAMV